MYKADNIQDFLDNIKKLLEAHLERENKKSLFNTDSPQELTEKLQLAIGDDAKSSDELFASMEEVFKATPSSSNPRFLNQLFGGREAMGIAADIFSLFSNSSMYTFKAAGAQILVENELLKNLCKAAGFIEGEGSFMPGGSLSNLGAMLLARQKKFPLSRDEGLGGEKPVFYTSEESHYSIRKNAGILGIGRNSGRFIPVDDSGSMNLEELRSAIEADLAQGFTPFFVNATAGTTVRGAFDPIAGVVDIAREYGLWAHVDGAFGASLLLSETHKYLLDGVSRADSLTWNPHKMMGVALQTSILLTRKRGELAGSFDETADYLFQSHSEDYNPGHRSLQCGRRNDAFRLWATWSRLGNKGWQERLDWQMKLAKRTAERIESHSELELFESPSSVNVCFNVKGKDPKKICEALNNSGRLKVGYGAIAGQDYIRLVCLNPSYRVEDLKWVLEEILEASKSVLTSASFV